MARTKTTGRKAEAPKVRVRVAEEEAVSQKVDVAKPDRPCAHVGMQDVPDQRPHEHLQQAPCDVVADAGVADAGKRAAALPAQGDTATAQPARNNATQATVSHSPTVVRGPDEPVTDRKKVQATAETMNVDATAPLGRGCRKRTARQRLAELEGDDSATPVPNTRANGMSPTQAKATVSKAPSPSAKGHASSPSAKAHAAALSPKADITSPGNDVQKRPREESARASAKAHVAGPSAKADDFSPGTNTQKRSREEPANASAKPPPTRASAKPHAAASSPKADVTSPGKNAQTRLREEPASASAKADATAPSTNTQKRPREESSNGGASSGAGAGSSGTQALVRSPTPPTPLRNAQSVFAVRGKRSRKGTAKRSSE